MKLFWFVLVDLAKAEADFEVVSCNNVNTKAPEMTIKARDLLTVIDLIWYLERSTDPWSKLKSHILL